MSGHSKWSTIKHKKGAADAKRAKVFTKIQRELMVAAKLGGPNLEFNPRLKTAIDNAKSANMPKERIQSAIKKATSSNEGENFEEIRYEGYGPNGVAFIVEALTDNRNRTASDVRSAFTKSGGSLGETGSVSFMFDKIGLIGYEGNVTSEEEMFEVALEAGAESVESDETWHEITCDPNNFTDVRDSLIEKFGDPKVAKITWKPKTITVLDLEGAEKILRLIDKLEDSDDVQMVIGNFEIPDDVAEKLE